MWAGAAACVFRCGAAIALAFAIIAPIGTALDASAAVQPVATEAEFRAAFSDLSNSDVLLGADIVLTCNGGAAVAARSVGVPLQLEGAGHSITQTCNLPEAVLASSSQLVVDDVTLNGGWTGLEMFAPLEVRNSTIQGQSGGTVSGIYSSVCPVVVANSVIRDISGSNSAIGIGCLVGTLDVSHTVVSAITSSGYSAVGVFGRGATTIRDSTIQEINGGQFTYGILANAGSGNVEQQIMVEDSLVEDVHGSQADGIANLGQGDARITRSTVRSVGAPGGSAGQGIVAEQGSVGVQYSTITDVLGVGSLAADASNDVTLENSTVTNNDGGVASLASVHLLFTDIVDNGAQGLGSSATAALVPHLGQVFTASLSAFGSVVATPIDGPNCQIAGQTDSGGYNLADDSTCGFTSLGDRQGVDPGLGGLADNGGPTTTRAPLPGSSLLGAIPVAACQSGLAAGVTTDQRGVLRPPGGTPADVPTTPPSPQYCGALAFIPNCDIGAVELDTVEVAASQCIAIAIAPRFTG